MTKFLLAVHVLAAIVAIGPVTVAASMFPPAARRPSPPRTTPAPPRPYNCCTGSAGCTPAVGIAVPVFGFLTAGAMGVLGDAWLIASVVLTVLAALVLVVLVLPRQEILAEGTTGDGSGTGTGGTATHEATRAATVQLAMFTGIFNLLWATVTVLMIVRPGSTTGA